ncbi:MAG TPA: hypothetical protein VM513_19525 [Kofleriaceae bacterium]|nr:hypothetical protein [Kofleriaceae bacterium]
MIRAALLAALIACSNSAPPAPPAPQPPATVTAKGRVETRRFASAALGVDKDVVVYLPAGYADAPGKRWPVLYYLHGLGGDERDWLDGGHLAEVADRAGRVRPP